MATNSTSEVAESLRRALLAGEFIPGTRLVEERLASAFGVSRVPVREALFTLVAEGLLERRPGGGAAVPHLTTVDLEQIYLARSALESILYEAAAPKLSEEDVLALEVLNEAVVGAVEQDDLRRLSEENRRFHFYMLERAAMPRILKIVSHLWSLTGSYRAFFWLDSSHRALTLRDHEVILDACRRRDGRDLVEIHNRHRQALTERQWPWINSSIDGVTEYARLGE